MTPLVEYWLKANLFLIFFYGCYVLLLRRHTFFALNRTYLIGSLILAFLLPLVHVPGLAFLWPREANVPVYTAVSVDDIMVLSNIGTSSEAPFLPEWPVLAMWAFGLVTLGLLVRTYWRTILLFRLIRQWPAQAFPDHTLVLPNQAQTPTFSFFRYLVLNPEDAQTQAVRQHELVHIRQKHSLDILFLEVIHAFCWLNPIFFGYRQALRQVHEYLADRDATPQTPSHSDAYARFLVDYAFHLPQPVRRGLVFWNDGTTTDNLAHSFGPDRPNSPTLKQRIQMLYQQNTNRRALWKYALVLPLATTLLAMTNEPESAPESVQELNTETATSPSTADSTALLFVQGLVYDQAEQPIPGAIIVIKNGHAGTTTDAKGSFILRVPAKTVLVASFAGFGTQEITVPDNTSNILLAFRLKPTAVNGTQMPMTNAPESVTVSAPNGPKSRGVGENEVFSVVEQNPTFPGGASNLYHFIKTNLRYPAAAARANVQGHVFVRFVVNTDGAIDRISVLKGLGFGTDEEAVRLMTQMPKWIPGKQNGRPVAVMFNLPIQFRLDNKVEVDVKPAPDALVGQSLIDSVVFYSPHTNHNDRKNVIYQNGNIRIADPNGQVRIYQPGSLRINDKVNPPLYIIDGEEVTQEQMENLDPNTIQRIDVIKDASAKLLHGEKGRNGVVKITTKKKAELEKKKE